MSVSQSERLTISNLAFKVSIFPITNVTHFSCSIHTVTTLTCFLSFRLELFGSKASVCIQLYFPICSLAVMCGKLCVVLTSASSNQTWQLLLVGALLAQQGLWAEVVMMEHLVPERFTDLFAFFLVVSQQLTFEHRDLCRVGFHLRYRFLFRNMLSFSWSFIVCFLLLSFTYMLCLESKQIFQTAGGKGDKSIEFLFPSVQRVNQPAWGSAFEVKAYASAQWHSRRATKVVAGYILSVGVTSPPLFRVLMWPIEWRNWGFFLP